jgi:hypothetical protein
VVIFKNIKIMEQLFTFLIIIFFCSLTMVIGSPIMFGLFFIGGLIYHIVRGKIKGWSLPNDIKKRHSW